MSEVRNEENLYIILNEAKQFSIYNEQDEDEVWFPKN